MHHLRRLTAVLLAVPLLFVAPGTAYADPIPLTISHMEKKHHAEFTGKIATNKRSGDTSRGTCNEIVTSGLGAGTFGCYVEWEFFAGVGGNICTVSSQTPGYVGKADYFSGTATLTIGDVRLSGASRAGGGLLTGTAIDSETLRVFRITIDAADACGATTLVDGMTGIDGESIAARVPLEFSGEADYT